MQTIREAKRTLTGQPKSQAEELEDQLCSFCPKLTYTQRITGFCCCWAGGYLLSFCSTLSLTDGSEQGMRNFTALYVLGNVIALCSTGFLLGPRRQCKKMFHPTRRVACIIYLVLLIAVFACALSGVPFGIVLVLFLIQLCAATWYAISYIPYGRQMVKSFFKDRCGCKK
ncbi:hypothetical protein TrLO_g7702 [Triparma laevis f. longispina]|uniref:Vesicle transport protein n=1 Tax=Triparma laevis f. longispina TaxID=1714387 RepID=A0A9W6ZUH2_9STRA|nr:hypothetical protein TrLO_g7702 [Triparma laevis f. longispina]